MVQRETRPAARLTVLSGPSGVGRHRVAELVRARSSVRWRPVPVTTRPVGAGEQPGVDYHFVDRGEFARLVEVNGLLEWAALGTHCYGTLREPIEARLGRGEPVLLSADLPGALQVRQVLPAARLVLLAGAGPPSLPPGVTGDATVVAESVSDAADAVVRFLGPAGMV